MHVILLTTRTPGSSVISEDVTEHGAIKEARPRRSRPLPACAYALPVSKSYSMLKVCRSLAVRCAEAGILPIANLPFLLWGPKYYAASPHSAVAGGGGLQWRLGRPHESWPPQIESGNNFTACSRGAPAKWPDDSWMRRSILHHGFPSGRLGNSSGHDFLPRERSLVLSSARTLPR